MLYIEHKCLKTSNNNSVSITALCSIRAPLYMLKRSHKASIEFFCFGYFLRAIVNVSIHELVKDDLLHKDNS